MATEIPVRLLLREGLETDDSWALDEWTVADSAGELTLPDNDGNVWIEFRCADAQLPTVKFTITLTAGGESLPAKEVTAESAGNVHKAGPWPPTVYNGADGFVTVTVETAGDPGNVRFRAFGI